MVVRAIYMLRHTISFPRIDKIVVIACCQIAYVDSAPLFHGCLLPINADRKGGLTRELSAERARYPASLNFYDFYDASLFAHAIDRHKIDAVFLNSNFFPFLFIFAYLYIIHIFFGTCFSFFFFFFFFYLTSYVFFLFLFPYYEDFVHDGTFRGTCPRFLLFDLLFETRIERFETMTTILFSKMRNWKFAVTRLRIQYLIERHRVMRQTPKKLQRIEESII